MATTNLGLTLPANAAQGWDTTLNANFTAIDADSGNKAATLATHTQTLQTYSTQITANATAAQTAQSLAQSATSSVNSLAKVATSGKVTDLTGGDVSTLLTVTPTATGGVPLTLQAITSDLTTLRGFGASLSGAFTYNAVFTGIDDTVKVQAMFNAAGSVNNPPVGLSADWDLGTGSNKNNTPQREVVFPPGSVFVVNGTISVPPGVRIRGNSSVVIQKSTAAIPTFSMQYKRSVNGLNQVAIPYTAFSGNSIHNLTVWGGLGNGTSLGTGILMGACQDFEISDVQCGGFRVGLDCWAAQYCGVYDSQFQGNVINILLRNYPTNATTDQSGGNSLCIDFRISNCRAAKSVNGYGLWIQKGTNVCIDQLDNNFCGKAALVLGAAIPDYISRILAVTPGAGYTPSPLDGNGNPIPYSLTVTDTKAVSLSAACIVGSSGTVTSAWMTDGLGNGAGISTSGTVFNLTTAGTPTTKATFTPNIQRDATVNFPDLLDTAVTPQAGLVTIDSFKAETAGSIGSNGTVGAPDCTYLIVSDAVSGIQMRSTKFSTYGRSASNYYRWAWIAGNADLDFQEFEGANGTIANPGVVYVAPVLSDLSGPNQTYSAGTPYDYGLIRVLSSGSTRIKFPHNIPVANFRRYVINDTGGSVVGGAQTYVETTTGGMKQLTGVIVDSSDYSGNARIQVLNSTPTTPRHSTKPFTVDGLGRTVAAAFTSPVISAFYQYYSTNVVFDFSAGGNQSITLNNNSTFTLANMVAGTWYTVEMTQDSTGSRTGSFSNNTIRWQGGTAPVLTTAAGKTDVFRFFYDGANVFGMVMLNF